MRQGDRLAGGPPFGFGQGRAGNQCVGFGKQPGPIGIVAGTMGKLPFPHGPIEDRVQTNQQERTAGTLTGSCVGR